MAEGRNLLKLIDFIIAGQMDSLPAEQKWRLAVQANYWGRIAEAWEKGEPINWNSFCGSPEIFLAMGIPSIMQEALSIAVCALPDKSNERYIDIAQENLVADHVCSTQKIMVGAAISGDLPPPTTIVHPAQPCDSTVVTYPVIAEHLGVPHFSLDIPTWKDERAVQYVADEIERMVAFLEEHTGKKLEYEKLRKVMEYSNAAHDYNLKMNELTKMVPSPIRQPMAAELMSAAGTPECVELYKRRYEAAKARAEQGSGPLPQEKLRLAWFSTWLAHDPELQVWLENEFGAIVVNTLLGTDTTPPAQDISSMRKIMEALARKTLNAPMSRECWGTLEHWFDYAVSACRDYKVDAVILTLHIGCKNIWAVGKLFKDKIADEVGIPTLIVEADFCDGRTFSSQGIRAQLSDFFNTMLV